MWAALVVYHLYPVQKLWAGAPDLQVVLHRLEGGAPPRALALVLFAKGFQVRAVSGLWLSSCANQVPAGLQDHAGPRPCGHDGQRPLPQDGGARGAPGSCSCTPAPSRSYWRCRGSRHTKSGYTGPLTPQSTSGQPSLHMTQEHWAADTSPGRRSWAGPYSLPPGDQLQKPRCHSNSQTGRHDNLWVRSDGPGVGGSWGPWKPLPWTLACSRYCHRRETWGSQPAGAPRLQTPHRGSIRTCSEDTRLQPGDSLATVAQEMGCGHQGSIRGGCVCSHGVLSWVSGVAGVEGAAEWGPGLQPTAGDPGPLWGYSGPWVAPGQPTAGL